MFCSLLSMEEETWYSGAVLVFLKHAVIAIFKERQSGSAVTNKKLICSLLMQVKEKSKVSANCAAYLNQLTTDLLPRHRVYYTQKTERWYLGSAQELSVLFLYFPASRTTGRGVSRHTTLPRPSGDHSWPCCPWLYLNLFGPLTLSGSTASWVPAG